VKKNILCLFSILVFCFYSDGCHSPHITNEQYPFTDIQHEKTVEELKIRLRENESDIESRYKLAQIFLSELLTL
jgi:hypothetical protein